MGGPSRDLGGLGLAMGHLFRFSQGLSWASQFLAWASQGLAQASKGLAWASNGLNCVCQDQAKASQRLGLAS